MTANFKPKDAPQIVTNRFAIPVGTSVILDFDKFMFDKRDINCNGCKNGFKSTLPKKMDNKIYNVNIVCTCVPYYQSRDAEGTGVVVYKGRRESWVKGIRPDSEIQAELIREGQIKNALARKNEIEDNLRANNNVTGNAKYQKALRDKENMEKAKLNGARPPQKVLQQDKAGHWIFVTLEQGAKLGGRISDPAHPVINPDKPETTEAQPASVPADESKAGRTESDEEFLLRTTGQAPIVGDPTFINKVDADKIEAAKPTLAPIVPPVAPTVPVRRGRGRPRGTGKK